jgi:hypothetical protein
VVLGHLLSSSVPGAFGRGRRGLESDLVFGELVWHERWSMSGVKKLRSLHHFAIAKRFIPFAVVVVLVSSCGSRRSPPVAAPSPQASLQRSAAKFRSITTNMTLQEVIDRFGMYDRVRGSGISYYQYDLPDGGAVLISSEWPFRPTNRIQAVGFYQSTSEIPLNP